MRNLFVLRGSVLASLVPHLVLALTMTALARVLQALGYVRLSLLINDTLGSLMTSNGWIC